MESLLQICLSGKLRLPSVKGADSHKVNVRSFFKYTEEISERQSSVILTFRILISLPRRIWDLDRFFLLMLLMATSQSVFCGTQRAGWRGKKDYNNLIPEFLENVSITT